MTHKNGNFKMLAKTLYGLEDLLAEELRKLGASQVETGVRNVTFEGDSGFMYKANLCCRTAIKILKPISSFNVFNEEGLYRRIKELPWEEHMREDGTLAVDATVFSKQFTHSKYIALKTKDAVVDRFRERTGTRPNVDLLHPSLRINVHIDRNICTVSLDSSGSSLHRRGYKTGPSVAPLNEVLAAGLIMLTGWNGQNDFLDPMTGSGTLLAEAAMIACNIPPNINRREFGFEHWPDFDQQLFDVIHEACLGRVKDCRVSIVGYDKDDRTVRLARENIKAANLEAFVQIENKDFFESKKESSGPLTIVMNPPYDERLPLENSLAFYNSIGSTLKHGYPGSQAWIFSANMDALKGVGLKPSRKIKLYNGKLESRLLKYELYQGSKKGESRGLNA
jgi:putative N6-adenine-specific DNA methylase